MKIDKFEDIYIKDGRTYVLTSFPNHIEVLDHIGVTIHKPSTMAWKAFTDVLPETLKRIECADHQNKKFLSVLVAGTGREEEEEENCPYCGAEYYEEE